MNFFLLQAIGTRFDVDSYLKKTQLQFDRVWRLDEVRGHPEFIQDRYENSGVTKLLGEGAALSIHEQDRMAIGFLLQHADEVRLLSRFPFVESVSLGLHLRVEIDKGVIVFCTTPSNDLMQITLEMGVKLFFYTELIR